MPSISHIRKKAPRAGAKSGPKPLENYVSDELLGELRRRGDWLERLQTLWQQHAGAPLMAHSRPISYRSGRLRVQADSSIWRDRVRQQQTRLMQALRQYPGLEDLVELVVRVAPVSEAASSSEIRKPDRLSAASAALVSAAAATIEDPQLRDALQRLSTHTERKR